MIIPEQEKLSGGRISNNFTKIAIPMCRQIFPQLIASELVGVQPMNGFPVESYMTFHEYLRQYYIDIIKEDFKDLIYEEFTSTELKDKYPVIYQEYQQAEAVFNL